MYSEISLKILVWGMFSPFSYISSVSSRVTFFSFLCYSFILIIGEFLQMSVDLWLSVPIKEEAPGPTPWLSG